MTRGVPSTYILTLQRESTDPFPCASFSSIL